MVKKLKLSKRGELPIPRIASPGGASYDFLGKRSRIGWPWRTNGLGAHPGFRHGDDDQELLARNEYLAAENRILKAKLKGRLKLSDAERATLGEIGHRLGRKVLGEVANMARPDTILAWYRKLVARKFDGSKAPRGPGRPRIKREVEQLIVRMAKENRDWGYDRIVGALANLGYKVCDQTVGNVLQRHGLPPAPERKTHDHLVSVHSDPLGAAGGDR